MRSYVQFTFRLLFILVKFKESITIELSCNEVQVSTATRKAKEEILEGKTRCIRKNHSADSWDVSAVTFSPPVPSVQSYERTLAPCPSLPPYVISPSLPLLREPECQARLRLALAYSNRSEAKSYWPPTDPDGTGGRVCEGEEVDAEVEGREDRNRAQRL